MYETIPTVIIPLWANPWEFDSNSDLAYVDALSLKIVGWICLLFLKIFEKLGEFDTNCDCMKNQEGWNVWLVEQQKSIVQNVTIFKSI